MAEPTNEEQLMLEYINLLRSDPQGEYARLVGVQSNIDSAISYFGVSLSAFQSQMDAISAAPPLAWNSALNDAAAGHNAVMIQYDEQTHRYRDPANPANDEPLLQDRLVDAGYTGWNAIAENIYAFSQDVLHAHAGFVIDWGFDDEDLNQNGTIKSNWQSLGDGIQDPAGHRNSLVSSSYTEIGISWVAETDPNTNVGPNLVTQNLGNRFSYDEQFVGVVIDDADGDSFYDIGEGLGGISITLTNLTTSATYTTTSWASGGWQIAVPVGNYSITFNGGSLGTITHNATLGATNVKVDAIFGNLPAGPTAGNDNLQGTAGNDIIDLLAGNDTYHGQGGNDTIIGGSGGDDIDGGTGSDTASYAGSPSAVNVQLQYGVASGGDAAGDTLTSIENLIGSDHGDTLTGNPGTNRLEGGGGNDFLKGLNGADELLGGGGDDWVYVDHLDTLAEGGTGTDRLVVVNGNGVTNAVGANGFEIATGNSGNDTFDGTGAGGSLTLRGLSGDDVLIGGDFDDYIYGDSGADELRGGDGLDRLFIDENDTLIDGGAGNQDRVLVQQLASASTGVNVDMAASNVEVAYGNLKNDTFDGSGSVENLSLYGRAGADTLIGGSGNDRLYGDNDIGGDTLNGGGGNDFLYGGANTGGFAERDVFVFDADWGSDRIFDFADNGFEKIDFTGVAGITSLSDLTITDQAADAFGTYSLISYADAGGWSGSIRVYGVTAAELGNNDFVFV